ncbi:unnamed protein product, partial [Rotaria magnacalcarata]
MCKVIRGRILILCGCKRSKSSLLSDHISAPTQRAVTDQIRTVSFDLGFVQSILSIDFMQIVRAINSSQRILHMESSEWLSYISANSERFNTSGLILKPDELANELTYPGGDIDNEKLNRIHGSMIGMALGDALGAHVEFRPRHYMVVHPVKELEGGGTWGLDKGQFTDDTSMALCLANSLIARQYYEPYDQLVRYKWWYRDGYMSSTGRCFDIGSATRQSLVEFERRQKRFATLHNIPIDELDFLSDYELLGKFEVNCSSEGVAGNGALMRLTPVPLFFYKHP